jgi:hypothetical protein
MRSRVMLRARARRALFFTSWLAALMMAAGAGYRH